jgi:Putative adhesin
MQKIVLRSVCLLTLLVLASAATAEAGVFKDKLTRTSPLKPDGIVVIENVRGGVTVEAWDRPEVWVEVEKQVESPSQQRARKALAGIRLHVKADGKSFRIKTLLPYNDNGFMDWLTGNGYYASVHYHVRVPRQAALTVENTNGLIKLVGTRGRAVVHSVEGGLALDRTAGRVMASINGGITVTRASGTVNVETINGGIEVELAQLAEESYLSLSTVNGEIELRLPRNIRVSLDATTSNGAVQSDFKVQGKAVSRQSLRGDINGGGGRLQVRTSNGSVRLLATGV